MRNRFAQNAARKQMSVAEGVCFVDKQKLDLPAKRQILEAVVQNESVRTELGYGVMSRPDAVFIDNNDYSGEVSGKHKRLVARYGRIKQNAIAVGNHARLGRFAVGKPTQNFARKAVGFAFVAAAENCDFAPAVGERSRDFFDYGRLPSAADGEVSYHDNHTPQRGIAQNALVIHIEAQPRDCLEREGNAIQKSAVDNGTETVGAVVDDVGCKVCEALRVYARDRSYAFKKIQYRPLFRVRCPSFCFCGYAFRNRRRRAPVLRQPRIRP